jgi:hypothetical protein
MELLRDGNQFGMQDAPLTAAAAAGTEAAAAAPTTAAATPTTAAAAAAGGGAAAGAAAGAAGAAAAAAAAAAAVTVTAVTVAVAEHQAPERTLKRGRQRNKQQGQQLDTTDNRGSKRNRQNTSEDCSRPNRKKHKAPHLLGTKCKTSSTSTKRPIKQKSKRRPRNTQKPPHKRQKTSGEFYLEAGAQALMAVIGGMCFVVAAL